MMLRHLLWKDSMTIKPLVGAILIGIVSFNAMVALITYAFAIDESANIFVSFWALMPNLIALGAPALLVGGEEESGTLSWLRTLPVSWKKVADSKFLAGLSAVLIAWIASSLVLALAIASTSSSSVGRLGVSMSSTHYADSMLSVAGISYLLFFSLLLLICGFITAYMFRSPVAGLIAVVPLISVLNLLALDAGRLMMNGNIRYAGPTVDFSYRTDWPLAFAGLLFLSVAWGLQRVFACRRLNSSQTDKIKNLATPESISAYRPPALVGASRPNPTTALLWQQWRQMGWIGVALTVMVTVFLLLRLIDQPSNSRSALRFFVDVALIVVALGASWLGGLAFYGDSVRRRCAYFADRGVSPTRIWWTRVAFPLLFCLALVALVGFVWTANVRQGGHDQAMHGATVVMIVIMFAFGQLVSQWMQRPILTFFAAPAFTVITCIVLVWLMTRYPTYYLGLLWIAPVLLFASWRLAGRWLSGRIDSGYHWRVLAYSALAVSIPILAVWTSRRLTTPQLMTQWRAKMLATQSPEAPPDAAYIPIRVTSISPDAFYRSGFEKPFDRATNAQRHEMLLQELASERIGDHVSLDDIEVALTEQVFPPTQPSALYQAAVSVLLKWDRQVREGVNSGIYSLRELELISEPAETMAIDTLERLFDAREATAEITQLIDSIPTSELRKQSRRNGLMSAWKSYQQQPWRNMFGSSVSYGRAFVNQHIGAHVAQFRFEQIRCDRYVDQLTRLLLEQLSEGLPLAESSPQFIARHRLWTEVTGPRRYPDQKISVPFGKHWTSTHETRIDRLRARAAAMPQNEL